MSTRTAISDGIPIWEAQGMPATMQGKDLIAYMDRGGVGPGTLRASRCGRCRRLCRRPRANLASDSRPYPDRIYGFVRVKPPRGRQTAIDEMHYWVRDRGFHAVKLNTIDASTYGAGCYSLADRALMNPVLEAITALRVPVMVHTGEEHGHTCTPTTQRWSPTLPSTFRRSPSSSLTPVCRDSCPR